MDDDSDYTWTWKALWREWCKAIIVGIVFAVCVLGAGYLVHLAVRGLR